MATALGGGQVKLNNGQTVSAQRGNWYDGQQFWNDTLSAPGVINSQSDQIGAGQRVSNEVIAQTNPNNVAYVQQQQQTYKPDNRSQALPPAAASFGGGGTAPTSGGGATGGTDMSGITSTQPTLNLPALYNQLYSSAGISDLEKQYSDMEKAYTEAKGKNNDNPFLSEATRVGREAKLSQLFTDRSANIKNDIATKKADVETKLNIQTKQFDINNQQAQQSLSQFNTLLSMGALDNASGDTIASITRSTGIPSDAIYSAINAKKQKDVQTTVTTVDDGKNQYAVVLNTNTGEIINKQILSSSKPQSTGTGSGIAEQQKQLELDKAQAPQYAIQAAKSGKTLTDMLSFYSQYGLDPTQIYNIYNTNSIYGVAKENKSTLRSYGIKV